LTGKPARPAQRMITPGIPMVSQSVLLRGVNDDAATLEALMRAFVECRINRITCITATWRPVRRICAPRCQHGQN